MKPYFETSLGKLYHGNCQIVLTEIEHVNLILTDPPYGIFVGGGQGVIGGRGVIEPTQYDIAEWDKEPIDLTCFELLRAVSDHQIIFGYNYISDILPPTRGVIVWDKKVRNNWFDKFSDVELAWTSFDMPARCFRHLWMGALRQSEQGANKRFHPTQKPVALMTWILVNFAEEGFVVCDPFAGSGSTLVSCERLGMPWIGIEISEKYCEGIAGRITGKEVAPANNALLRTQARSPQLSFS